MRKGSGDVISILLALEKERELAQESLFLL